jgi:hypothetical protein
MRYLALVAIVVAAMVTATYSARAADNIALQSVTVTFHTRGTDAQMDSKKADTHVLISLFTHDANGGHTFAQQHDIDPNTAFDDPSDKGPYDVRVLKQISKSDFLTSKTGLQIIPSGEEKWCVKVEITATFDDGSTLTVNSDTLEMTGSNSWQVFDNHPTEQ